MFKFKHVIKGALSTPSKLSYFEPPRLILNGIEILMSAEENNIDYYVAIRPICEILGIDYNEQILLLQNDELLSSEFINLPLTNSKGNLTYEYCLQYKYIKWWIMTQPQTSKEFRYSLWDCDLFLHAYFLKYLQKRLDAFYEIEFNPKSTIEDKVKANEWDYLKDPKPIEIDNTLIEMALTLN